MSPTKRKHNENEDSDEEHMNKMRRLIASHLYVSVIHTAGNFSIELLNLLTFFCTNFFRRNPNGEAVNQEPWNYSSFGRASLSALHSRCVFTPFPIFAVDQPIEMTKHSSDPARSVLLIPGSGTEPQQVRLTRAEIVREIFLKRKKL